MKIKERLMSFVKYAQKFAFYGLSLFWGEVYRFKE